MAAKILLFCERQKKRREKRKEKYYKKREKETNCPSEGEKNKKLKVIMVSKEHEKIKGEWQLLK